MRVAAVAVILFLAAAVPVNLLPSTFYTDAAWWHALDLDGDRWDDGLQVSGLRQSVLVEFPRIPTARDVSDLEAAGFDVALAFHRFPRVHASIDRPPASYELPADVLFVERDRPVFPALDVAAVAIRARGAASAGGGAPAPQSVWEGLGVTGAGVIVAVLDTGVHDRHSAFGDALVAEFDCSKACAADIALDLDPNGHGTHVAGTLLSRDAVFRGIAPAARLVDVKVASEVGVAVELAFLSGIQRGLQQVLDYNEGKAPEEQIRVVNVSFGSQPGGSGDDSTTEAVDAVVATGVVVVVAAGNCGPAGNPAECAGRQGDRDTITSPGTAADAITVAALDDRNTPARSDDTVADYSSRGTNGGAPKPDVAAPGTNIRSPTNIPAGDGFGDISGTSFSAPAVAGVVALMLQADPSLLPADVKRILRETAEDVGPAGFDPGTGEGSVDAFAAVARVLAEKDGGGPVNGTNRPPAAEAGGPYRGEAGRLVTLRGIATDPDGRIVEYSWDFEDDGTVDVRSKVNGTAGHVYDAPGNFTARFRAGDDAGATAEDVARVEIRPRADFGRPTPDPEENVTEPEGPDRGGKSRVGGGIPAISAGAFVGGAALLALLLRERRR